MARLFITPKEIDFIADLTKEVTKDVIGQVIYYYRVRQDVSNVHDIYNESIDKIFDPPIEIDCRFEWDQGTVNIDNFSYDRVYNVSVYIHFRDMLDRNIDLMPGDFFSFGENFFEITTIVYDKMIFGQIEHLTGYILKAKTARKGLINKKPIGPTSEVYTDDDAVKTEFTQQRGDTLKNDKRQLTSDGTLEEPITGAKTVKKDTDDTDAIKSSFYGDQ